MSISENPLVDSRELVAERPAARTSASPVAEKLRWQAGAEAREHAVAEAPLGKPGHARGGGSAGQAVAEAREHAPVAELRTGQAHARPSAKRKPRGASLGGSSRARRGASLGGSSRARRGAPPPRGLPARTGM